MPRVTLGDRLGRLEPEFLRSAETRRQVVLGAIVALVVAFLPIAGLLLAGFVAVMRHRDGDSVMRNVMLALAIFALWELTSLENQGGIGWDLL